MKPIEAEKIWKMDLNPKDNQLKEVNDKYNDEKEEVKAQVPENHPEIKKAQIPISYKQLQDYGYCIISIQKYDSEGHSKYKLAPVNIQLTFLQKELQLKHKLTGLPSFFLLQYGCKLQVKVFRLF